jgi:hypothetical protein
MWIQYVTRSEQILACGNPGLQSAAGVAASGSPLGQQKDCAAFATGFGATFAICSKNPAKSGIPAMGYVDFLHFGT